MNSDSSNDGRSILRDALSDPYGRNLPHNDKARGLRLFAREKLRAFFSLAENKVLKLRLLARKDSAEFFILLRSFARGFSILTMGEFRAVFQEKNPPAWSLSRSAFFDTQENAPKAPAPREKGRPRKAAA
jgi:hypothetical protein